MSANGLFQLMVDDDVPAKKKPRKEAPLFRLPTVTAGESLNKLMAVAHYRAETLRAAQAQREPDWVQAERFLNTDPFTWGKKQKHVHVLWSYRTPEVTLFHEAAEVPFRSLCG